MAAIKSLLFCVLIVLSLAGCTREPTAPGPPADKDVVSETALLATIPADHEPTGTDFTSGENEPVFRVMFHERGRGVAYIAKIDGVLHVVHNGEAGRPLMGIDQIRFSPDGSRIAYSAQFDGRWGMIIDGVKGADSDEVGDPVFSPDGKHIAYEVKSGGKWSIAVDDMVHAGCRSQSCSPVFSADSKKIAYVERADEEGGMRLIVSDLEFETQDIKPDSGALMVTNPGKTRVAAVSTVNGRQRVIEFGFARPEDVREGRVYDSISHLAFGGDGVSVAYVAQREGKRYLVLNGKEEPLTGGAPRGLPVVRPENKGVGIIIDSNGESYLHEAFSSDEREQTKYDDVRGLVYSGDGSAHAYTARKGENWFVVVNGKEGPVFDIVVTPLFSPDGRRLVYRARDEGRRFVVAADTNGETIKEHPAYEQVFQPVFTPDGKAIAYGVKDGSKLIWKVEERD